MIFEFNKKIDITIEIYITASWYTPKDPRSYIIRMFKASLNNTIKILFYISNELISPVFDRTVSH